MFEATYGRNFTGAVDFAVTINGIDWKSFNNGFFYYIQPKVHSIYPKTGPSKGNALVKVYGEGFRSDFNGADLGCRIGNAYGKGEFISESEVNCRFNRIPLLDTNHTHNFSFALNNYSFVEENSNLTFVPYGIMSISPPSGPIEGNTRIVITGSGFYKSKNIRCRFGVPGYYAYTEAEFINFYQIVCNSPVEFNLPYTGQLPFSVPFSIAFNDDNFSKHHIL